ncbi:MAG: hypothetical protein ACM3O7_05400 [Acidobacteriota bacterium]
MRATVRSPYSARNLCAAGAAHAPTVLLAASIMFALGGGQAEAQISAAPPSVSIFPTQTSSTVTLTIANITAGVPGTHNVVFSGLPAGVTANPPAPAFTVPATLPATATTTFQFQAAATASLGTYTINMQSPSALCGSILCMGTMTLQVLQPSFTALASPNPASVPWGGTRTVTVTITPDPGFTQTLTIWFGGFPAGISVGGTQVLSPPYPPLPFTFSVAAGITPQTYNGTLFVTPGNFTPRTFPMTVIVPPPDILVAFSQPSVSVCDGGPPVNNGIVLQPANGYAGTPLLSFSSIPAGITVTPTNPTAGPMPPGQTVPFTVSASGATPGLHLVTLQVQDAAAGIAKTAQLSVNVPAADFVPSVAPSALSVPAGGSAAGYVASVAGNACFSPASVTVTPSGAPGGVTFSPPAVTLMGPTYIPAGFNVQVAPTVPPGSYPLTFTFAPSTGAPRTRSGTLTVTAGPDFTLAASPASLAIQAGATGTVMLTATGLNGFNDAVTVTTPSIAGVTFTPASFTILPGGSQPVAVQVAQAAPPGTLTATFTGTSPTVIGSRTAALTLQITAAPDFSLAVNPPTLSVVSGSSGTVTVTATGLNGFADAVAVTAPLIAGVTFAPATFALLPGGSQSVAVQVAQGTLASLLTATFTGTSATVPGSRTSTLTLQITPPPDFALALTPPTLSITAGVPATVVVAVTAAHGFTGTVNVTAVPSGTLACDPASFTVPAGGSQTVTLTSPPEAAAAMVQVRFEGTAAGIVGSRQAILSVTLVPAPPVIESVTPPALTPGTTSSILRLTGQHFRPGAVASSPSPGLVVTRTTVLSPTMADVVLDVHPKAPTGLHRIDLTNPDGTRTSQGFMLVVYPSTSIGAALGVTVAAIVHPRPYTLLHPSDPVFPRGLLATTGLGTVIGSWNLDGFPFDRFVVPVSGGMPVEVRASIPIPATFLGEHRLELVVEQPRSLISAPIPVVVSTDGRSQLTILAPEDGVVFGTVAPLVRWSMVPGASGYEVEIGRDADEFPLLRRLSATEWRPSTRDVAEIGPGPRRLRVRAVFPGDVTGEPTRWLDFFILPARVELTILAPSLDHDTGRPVIRWEGGAPGLLYRVELFAEGAESPFAAAVTPRQEYALPPGTPSGPLQVRIRALDPEGHVRGSAGPATLTLPHPPQASLGRIVLARLDAQVTAMSPREGDLVDTPRPRIEARWSSALPPEEVTLLVDATDFTPIARVEPEGLVLEPVEELAPGPHTVFLSLAGVVTTWTFAIVAAVEAPAVEPALGAASSLMPEPHRDGEAVAMLTVTGQDEEGGSADDTARLELSTQLDVAQGAIEVKGTGDVAGRHDLNAPHATVNESRNWDLLLAAGGSGFRTEARGGYSPPDFLDQSEFLSAGLARGGLEGKVVTSLGSLAYYRTTNEIPSGTAGMPLSGPQRIEAIGYEVPGDPNRFFLRAFALRSESEASFFEPGAASEAAGLLGRIAFGPGLALVFEGAHGWVEPADAPEKVAGDAFRVGATGTVGRFNYSLAFRKTDADFINPTNPGLTPGGVPDRTGGDLSLTAMLGRASVSLQARRLESGGNEGGGPKVVEDGGALSVNLPLGERVTAAATGTLTTNRGDGDEALYLPATDRSQRGVTLTLTEMAGTASFSQSLSWQDMDDKVQPAANQAVTALNLSANGALTRVVSLSGTISGTRSDAAPALGRTDQFLVSLQPVINWQKQNLVFTLRGSYNRSKNEASASLTESDQYQIMVQWTPPWLGSLLAAQLAADWNRTRSSYQPGHAPFHRRLVASLTVRKTGTLPPLAQPVTAAGLPPGIAPGRIASRL